MRIFRKRKQGYYFFILLLLSILLLCPYLYLQYTGFCFETSSYLSDDELISNALAFQMIDEDNRSQYSIVEVNNFKKENPNCCHVDRHPEYRSALDVISGFNYLEVEVNYSRKKVDPLRNTLGDFYKAYVIISPCGHPIKAQKGTSTEQLETASQ